MASADASRSGNGHERHKKRSRKKLVAHTPEFSVFWELVLVAKPGVFAQVRPIARAARAASPLTNPAGARCQVDLPVPSADDVGASDGGVVATRVVAALVAAADSLRVYVVNDDTSPHPQFHCLAALTADAVSDLESFRARCVPCQWA